MWRNIFTHNFIFALKNNSKKTIFLIKLFSEYRVRFSGVLIRLISANQDAYILIFLDKNRNSSSKDKKALQKMLKK